ncbi:MAG: winged helix-turn-helix transcriptional regulator [Spirochaetes bacterium]|nr:winged helix-turn-helix transcriptional regulator [Spirochaetota bacterium]
MNPSDTELQLLETIYSRQGGAEGLTQRDLAGAAGLSLGMTNALLRRFIERGWVKLLHLSGRSLRYILTSEGLEEVLHRSIAYFTRAVHSTFLYRDKINTFVRGLAKAGFSVLVLEGPVELDFLFDYSCERYGLDFVKNPKAARREALAALSTVMFVKAKAFDGPEDGCDEAPAGSSALKAGLPQLGASSIQFADILFDRANYLPVGSEASL